MRELKYLDSSFFHKTKYSPYQPAHRDRESIQFCGDIGPKTMGSMK